MSGPALPARLAIPDDKIAKYLLNPEHPKGGSKARLFLAFGFSADRSTEFADAIFAQAVSASAVTGIPTEYGREMLSCVGPISAPSGRTLWVRSVWLVDLDGIGRLVTLVPDRQHR